MTKVFNCPAENFSRGTRRSIRQETLVKIQSAQVICIGPAATPHGISTKPAAINAAMPKWMAKTISASNVMTDFVFGHVKPHFHQALHVERGTGVEGDAISVESTADFDFKVN